MDDPKAVAKKSLIGIGVGFFFLLTGFFSGSTVGQAMGFIVLSTAVVIFVVATLLGKAS